MQDVQMRGIAGVLLAVATTYVPLAHGQTTTTIAREFYPTGLLKSETRDGVKTSYTYTATGDVATVTDARGYITQYSNYKLGIARTEVRAKGKPEQVTIYREVNDLGCLTSETDGENNKIVYTRDALCRIKSVTPAKPGSVVTSVVYEPYGLNSPETRTATRGNYVETSKFDGFGRMIEKTAGGVKRAWKFDALGRRVFESYPVDQYVTSPTGDSFEYDTLKRLKKVTHADGKTVTHEYLSSPDGAPQTRITTKLDDLRSNVLTQSFRAFGSPGSAELMAISTPVTAANITLKRNVRGQVTDVIQGGVTRTYGYDSRYYLTTALNPETGTTTYGRNALGGVASVKTGVSGTTYFDINGLGQVTGIRYPDSSKNVSQTWYKNGLQKTASNGASTLSWTYDPNRNLTQESLAVGAHEFATDYAYDGNDRRSTITYPKKGSKVVLAPDVLGRPTKVGSFLTSISYHPNGTVKEATYANGVKTSISPDARQRPNAISVGKGGGSAYVGMTIDYDGANSVISVTDAANSTNNRAFGYDGIERLTNVKYGGVDYPITYDGIGNITKQTFGGVLNYVYDNSTNLLTSTAGKRVSNYAYDPRGNVSSDGVISFQYDDNSRLRCAKCGTTGEIAYDYDALGKRMSRTKGGQTAYLVYGGSGDLLLEFNPTTNQRQEHIYLKGQRIATSTQSAYFATAIVLTPAATSIEPGQVMTLTATVTGGRNPDGVVDFYDNGILIGSATLVNGKATLTTSALGFGYHNFTASYEGDGANAVSNTSVATRVESGKVTATITTIINSLLLDD